MKIGRFLKLGRGGDSSDPRDHPTNKCTVMNKKIIPVIIIIKRVVKTTRLQDQQPIVGVLL